MIIHRIRTQAEYRATLKEISALVGADPDLGTLAGDRLNALISQAHRPTNHIACQSMRDLKKIPTG
jgi:antitoxin component HigA of HigAB toxin-antitoxin module